MKRIFSVILVISLLFCFAACSQNTENEYPVKIASYTFEEKPDCVVCLSDSVADIIIACGYMDMIKGRSDECTQAELSSVASVGTKSKPNTQKILELEPDVVFADKTIQSSVVEKLKEKNITILTMMPAQSINELTLLYSNICAVLNGDITGRQNGESKANSISLTMDDLQRIVPETEVVVTACYLYDTDGTSATTDTFCGKLFSYANCVNVCSAENSANMLEVIELSDPQYIFCDKGVKQKIESDEAFKDFTAVKNGNIYEIDHLLFERQGNSITQVLSYMIETIYPEVSSNHTFSDESSTQETSDESSTDESSTDESSTDESSTDESSTDEPSTQESSDESSVPETSLEITDNMWYRLGEEDDNVRIIQERLVELGFMNDDPTGYYGQVTFDAVQAFEEANGLTADGFLENSDLRLLFSEDVVAAE